MGVVGEASDGAQVRLARLAGLGRCLPAQRRVDQLTHRAAQLVGAYRGDRFESG